MRTGEDNRIALMPPAFYSCSRSTFDMYRACYVFALALCSLVLRICLATWVNSGSGAVGRGLQSEDAVVVFVRSCGSVCNKPTIHTLYAYSPRLSGAYVKAVRVRDSHPQAIRSAHHHIIIQKDSKVRGRTTKSNLFKAGMIIFTKKLLLEFYHSSSFCGNASAKVQTSLETRPLIRGCCVCRSQHGGAGAGQGEGEDCEGTACLVCGVWAAGRAPCCRRHAVERAGFFSSNSSLWCFSSSPPQCRRRVGLTFREQKLVPPC